MPLRGDQSIAIGVDIGTSGIRAIAINAERKPISESSHPFTKGDYQPKNWQGLLEQTLDQLFSDIERQNVCAIAIDGTSATIVGIDHHGAPISEALLYNDDRATSEAELIAQFAPATTAAQGASSALAKAMWLQSRSNERIIRFLPQSSWCSAILCGNYTICDPNNALKLGFDPVLMQWPEWIEQSGISRQQLPTVLPTGEVIAPLRPYYCERWQLSANTLVINGTTDSTAALIATGATETGDAVTALGSTLVLKIISDHPLFNSEYGIYSQPLGKHWLVGGASNSGGSVLKRYFSDEEITRLSMQIDPSSSTNLHYYPLPKRGERFPIADPQLEPKLEPRPASDTQFLKAMFEGLAEIEYQGYKLLQQLGAPRIKTVRSNGGGAKNKVFTQIRQNRLGVTMSTSTHHQAAFGAALIALNGFKDNQCV